MFAGQPIRFGCAKSSVMAASGRARRVPRRRVSKSLNARTANFVRPMRYCAKPQRILLRRSSTARFANDCFRFAGLRFIEESREALGVEPICRALQLAPSTFYDRRAISRDPDRASARAKSDAALSVKIDGAWEDNPNSMEHGRSGTSCGGRVMMWPAAPWSG